MNICWHTWRTQKDVVDRCCFLKWKAITAPVNLYKDCVYVVTFVKRNVCVTVVYYIVIKVLIILILIELLLMNHYKYGLRSNDN